MPLFRYVGESECLHLGPPVRVLSRGDVVPAPRNPDPTVFQLIDPQAEPPTREPLAQEQDAPSPGGGIARAGKGGRNGETP